MRKKTTLSQKKFAEKIGVSSSTYEKWKLKHLHPRFTPNQWVNLAETVGMEMNELADFLTHNPPLNSDK
ncbi:hypothetical protein [Roseofilum sp. Guam]|uniref:hypothetical protein n=1 Tax=Roseofilum sp. Guam TaxID=2821502 RepID=UPI00399F8DC2